MINSPSLQKNNRCEISIKEAGLGFKEPRSSIVKKH